jgi:hypothetical protein
MAFQEAPRSRACGQPGKPVARLGSKPLAARALKPFSQAEAKRKATGLPSKFWQFS